MSFGDALILLKGGSRAYRRGWDGKCMWIAIERPDAHSHMSLPFLYMHMAQGGRVPWLATQTDALAEDWEAVPAPHAHVSSIDGRVA